MVHQRKGKLSDPHLNVKQPIVEQSKKNNKGDGYLAKVYCTPRKEMRLKPPNVHKVTSVNNIPRVTPRLQGLHQQAPPCKRSLSLQDLSPALKKQLSKRRALVCIESDSLDSGNMIKDGDRLDERSKKLAFKVYSKFLRKAWMRKKEESDAKDVFLRSAYSQNSNMKMQISTLKSIVESDEQVLSSSFKEIHGLKSLLASLQEIYTTVKEEKEDLQKTHESLKEELNETRTESLNDKNSLLLLRSEAASLELQLQKERDKIVKLRTENKSLTERVDSLTVNLKYKIEERNCLKSRAEQLEQEVNRQAALLESAHKKIVEGERALEDATGCLKLLRKQLVESVTNENNLRQDMEDTMTKMEEQKEKLDMYIKEQTLKVVKLETDLALAEPRTVRKAVLRVASAFISVPLVVLETIAVQR